MKLQANMVNKTNFRLKIYNINIVETSCRLLFRYTHQ